jgi:hypothetical protein
LDVLDDILAGAGEPERSVGRTEGRRLLGRDANAGEEEV